MAFHCLRGLLFKQMLVMLSADSCFSVNLLKPNCMTQMKPTVCTKLAIALTLSIPKLVVLGEWCFFTEQMRATLVWAWPQTGTRDWTRELSRRKTRFFLSHLTSPHHSEKISSGIFSRHIPLLSPYSFSLVATATPGSTGKAWRHSQ